MVTVDTHIIIWEALDPAKLSKKAKIEFDKANASDGLIFCDISLWEISMLMAKRRMELEVSYLDFIDLLTTTRNYIFQPNTPEIVDLSTELSQEINSGPADRMIAATSSILDSPLITADKTLRSSRRITTIW